MGVIYPFVKATPLVLLFFLTWCLPLCAALSVKDNYRSARNPERDVRKSTRLIVLHTTEAPAKSSLNKLSERGEAHFCVTENGTIYRIVDQNREAFHAGRSMWNGKEDCDTFSIGIEVVGYHDQAMPRVQLKALNELVTHLKKTYKLSDAQVVCHSHVAYGAPNPWHKKRHRGRKRCGMLFAMPSVRALLGLSSRPAADWDVRTKRLVQADSYLEQVLYGKVDTMALAYRPRPQPVAPVRVSATVPKPKPPSKAAVAARPLPSNLRIGKKTDGVRDLEALVKLPGYVRGGPVNGDLSPYRIAGSLWNAPSTYYYGPRGKIEKGDQIDMHHVEVGTFIFYKSERAKQ